MLYCNYTINSGIFYLYILKIPLFHLLVLVWYNSHSPQWLGSLNIDISLVCLFVIALLLLPKFKKHKINPSETHLEWFDTTFFETKFTIEDNILKHMKNSQTDDWCIFTLPAINTKNTKYNITVICSIPFSLLSTLPCCKLKVYWREG